MREARRLAPYAAFSAFVVIASVAALLLSTLRLPVGVNDSAGSPSPSATALVRPAIGLSSLGHLAYWRTEPNGERVLWVADLDNSRRRSLARTSGSREVTATRWSVDGNAVGFVEQGTRLVVARLDGTQSAYDLPVDLIRERQRIVDHRFSPSGRRVAVTVRRAPFNEFDVLVSDAAGSLARLTTLQDVTAADWISEDQLLVATSGGVVALLDTGGPDRLRPLTGVFGLSPLLARDGRVYFLGGSGFATQQGAPQFNGPPAVWSMTVDGDDLRREATPDLSSDADRLDGVLPAGFLVHGAANRADALVTRDALFTLNVRSEVVDRATAAADGRSVIAFSGTNILRFEIGADGRVASGAVLLGAIDQGDVWFPRAASPAHVAAKRADVPPARYAFFLGGHLWTMGADGIAALGEVAPAHQAFGLAPTPRWSPDGDRVLVVEALQRSTLQLVPVVVGADRVPKLIAGSGGGSPSSLAGYAYTGSTATWSPDGSRVAAIANTPGGVVDGTAASRSVFVFDAVRGGVVTTFLGREAYWTRAGIAVLSPGSPVPNSGAREGQALELHDGDATRTIVTIAALAADPRSEVPAGSAVTAQGVTASDDGAYVGIQLTSAGAAPSARLTRAFVAVRSRDGSVALVIGSNEIVSAEAWSPSGRAIGYTRGLLRQFGDPSARAVVRDVESGAPLLDVEGRFAGWSPDGSWVFVARADGLYARALAGGELQRFSSLGVTVATTKP